MPAGWARRLVRIGLLQGHCRRGARNFGAVTTLNVGVPIPGLHDYGLGWQTGIGYGVYDFDGRITGTDTARSQQQTFVTTGFFRKANCDHC